MERFVFVCLTLVAGIYFAFGSPTDKSDCPAYGYCQGESFPSEVPLRSRKVGCDVTPEPRRRCCLPHSPHLVCYNINVDNMLLTYQPTIDTRTTNFTALCAEMVASLDKTPNRYSVMTYADEGGELIWRKGDWHRSNGGPSHILTLACGINVD